MPKLGYFLNKKNAQKDDRAFHFCVTHGLDINHWESFKDSHSPYAGTTISHCNIAGHNPRMRHYSQGFIKQYLEHVLRKYGKYIDRWILLNEYYDDNGQVRKCFEHLGAHFPRFVFETAKRILPEGKFLLSDYQLEKRKAKCDLTLSLLTSLGGLVDGVGLQLQSHTVPLPNMDGLADLVGTLEVRGLTVDFTEVTCWNAPLNNRCLQGGIYKGWLDIAVSSCVEHFCFWAPWDDCAWYPERTRLTQLRLLPRDRAGLLASVQPGLWDNRGDVKSFAREILMLYGADH